MGPRVNVTFQMNTTPLRDLVCETGVPFSNLAAPKLERE